MLLMLTLSSIFYTLAIAAGSMTAGRALYVIGLMWCPGLAALATKAIYREPVGDLGWGWRSSRYVAYGYWLPVAYAVPVYLLVWAAGLGGFPNPAFVEETVTVCGLPGLPPGLVVGLYVLLVVTVGLPRAMAAALGEEVGWRGFLLPELVRVTTVPRAALLVGLIWAAWHYPGLLLADYNLGAPWWVALPCFTAMVTGVSFLAAWLRLRSGSIWPAVVLHASHNLWIQQVLTPLTARRGPTTYLIDEFGVGLAVSCAVAAAILFRRAPPVLADSPASADRAAEPAAAPDRGGLS
jgi:membrane protease YdiL (CAAX protease family)